MSLFHYTDAAAVLSIIEKKELWLTDIRFMNDSDEAVDGAKYVIKEIQDITASGNTNTDEALLHLQDFTLDGVNAWLAEQHAFICSFSKTGDHLVQWRSYGNYAIEFHDDLITDLAPILECVYNIEEKATLAKELVSQAKNKIESELKKGDELDGYDIAKALWDLGDAVNLFKHPSFIEENEMRIFRLERSLSELINYRVRGGYLIPYLKVPYEARHIKAIHIGPMKNQDLAIASMTSFLNNFELRNNKGSPWREFRIKIVPSSIPYREV